MVKNHTSCCHHFLEAIFEQKWLRSPPPPLYLKPHCPISAKHSVALHSGTKSFLWTTAAELPVCTHPVTPDACFACILYFTVLFLNDFFFFNDRMSVRTKRRQTPRMRDNTLSEHKKTTQGWPKALTKFSCCQRTAPGTGAPSPPVSFAPLVSAHPKGGQGLGRPDGTPPPWASLGQLSAGKWWQELG